MARVKRFIYNSDFMTLAKSNANKVNVTIPATNPGPVGIDVNYIATGIKVPKGAIMRASITYGRYNYKFASSDGLWILNMVSSTKKQHWYVSFFVQNGELYVSYVIFIEGYGDSGVLVDAQTFLLEVVFLYPPNA